MADMDKHAAFRKLYDESRDRIYRMCCYYVSSEEDRKDLYQEVFQNLWKGLGSFRGDSTLSTWAYRVTVNSALSFLAKVKARKETSAEYAELVLSRRQQDEEDAGDDAIDLLRSAIAKLQIVDMIVMSLVLEGASTREIAQTTGLTESNVRVRIHRSKEKLRRLIEGERS
jgi:RNA polymerase sigma-70 factor (ECF subfamily)